MKLDFFPEVIVRTPFFSLDLLDERSLDGILNEPAFLEALFISSPDLIHLLNEQSFATTEEITNAVYKYFVRMCCRCTPFGLFAGCGLAKWGDESKLVIARDAIIKRTRLDREFLDRLIEHMLNSEEIFKRLRFFPNNTLYPCGEELRYIEKIAVGNNRTEFNISAVNNSTMLADFLNFVSVSGRNYPDIVDYLSERGCSKRKSQNYIRALHKNQLLHTNLSLALPASELLVHCEMLLRTISTSGRSKKIVYWSRVIITLKQLLDEIDNCQAYSYRKYSKLLEEINKLPFEQPLNRLIQVDYAYKKLTGTISRRVQNKLALGIQVLSLIHTDGLYNAPMENFKRRFMKKYEFQEVPILTALDPESGIDYLEGASSFDEFLYEEFGVGSNSQKQGSLHLNFNQKYVIGKFENAANRNEQVIELTENDLDRMEIKEYSLPATSSIFFSLLGDDRIQIESVGGSSGINLFARFTDFNPQFRKLAEDIASTEQRFEPDKIAAEVIHEPEPRAGNVIAHPSFRCHDIPYLSRSAKTPEDTIPLDDLVISVVNNRLIIKSVRYNKEVIPYLSHAYNYLRGAPIFRFFGDFQNAGRQGGFHFDFMQILPDKLFYPRLSYKNIVFSPATWVIGMKDIEEKYGAINEEKLLTYLSLKKVASKFVLSEGDNELLICLGQRRLLNIFLKHLKKRKEIIIREFLVCAENYPVINDDGQIMNNQLIAIVKHPAPNRKPPGNNIDGLRRRQQNVQRKFSLGSEWVYFKFYCGSYSGDKVLVNNIFPLVKKLKKKKLITEAFFIRYFDPDPHLRVRFKVRKNEDIQHMIEVVREFMLGLEQANTIWKTQTDTYVRELERYPMVITESESLFSFDSFAILQLLSCPQIIEDACLRMAAGIRLVSDLIHCVKTDIDEKIAFVRSFGHLLKGNCGLEAASEKKINNSYREKSVLYFSLLRPNEFENIFAERLANAGNLLNDIVLKNQTGNLMIDMDSLLGSYIHMCVNRLFMSNQKIYEYVIYDYLYKYYNRLKNKPA